MKRTTLVCGSRYWGVMQPDKRQSFVEAEIDAIFTALDKEHENQPITTVVHGAAPGADTLAGQWAKSRGIPVREFPANWREFGKRAGPIRNQQMLDENDIDDVVAFTNDIESSRGTRDMVTRAMKADIPVNIVRVEQA